MLMTLLSSLNRLKNVSRGSWLGKSNGVERTESKCRKDKDHDLRYGTGPPAEFRRVSVRGLSHWSRQQQHLLQWLQALGAQEMQWAQALDKRPQLQMYTVPGNCTPLGWQTTVCRTGVGSNSIFCNGCKHWVHKKCSGLKLLTKDPDYRCTRCQGTAHPLDGRPHKEVQTSLRW